MCCHHKQSCSAASKATKEGVKLRNEEYKQLVKADSRELKRLRRQVKTYETLVKGEWASQMQKTLAPATAALPAVNEHVEVGDDQVERLLVDASTVKRLWRERKSASERAAQLEDELATLVRRSQVAVTMFSFNMCAR